MGEAERSEAKLPLAKDEVVKSYIANFYQMEEYQSFAAYLRRFDYVELLEKVDELFLALNTVELKAEILARYLKPLQRKQLSLSCSKVA